ncbi:CDP-glycerol glycerophosphotransferase family protein [Acinetobacter lwoffii]|uniref:CDP-glycerol glycerophosphotransferase family protein n=1 Tax=Acinetobacter lwoffii TaxID=28090 RepID=A0AAW8ATE8_ACILW|nr:CDP-glycerol glycerophosphotransferase family protein [Acinetobacter lwoffii]MDP1369841.1 CDP-glycerol glycerophosphotransferase family protein [Acinetobacter lwoffii]MDP1389276.1 CDP-glycerol glycerophosphotransferase family protein [Acinetobacter lwoffii]MDP1446942.1 CDP-glycerol glycerophosphotransferase family protein [Acinetobacter lwoffii]
MLTTLESKNVKALSELKVYKDIDFKKALDTKLPKGYVFKADTIEVTKGGTPRLKIVSGYVTANKKFVNLTDELITKKKIIVNGKEILVRDDIENYIYILGENSVQSINQLKIYKDIGFKNETGEFILAQQAFKADKIEFTKNGTPRLKIKQGYVTANKKFVIQLNEYFFPNKDVLKNIDISVILPVYNVQEYLVECLESILSEKTVNLEVIAVNDGATDSSLKILQDFYKKDYRVKIVNKNNEGLGAARNTGVKYAKGKYIWFVDSDDIVEQDAIKKSVLQLNKTGSDFIVTSYTYLVENKKKRPAHWIRNLHNKKDDNTNLLIRPDVMVNVPAWTKIYRKSFWQRNKLYYPERVLYEDQVPSIKSYTISSNFDIVDFPTIQWRQRTGLVKSITQNHLDYKNLSARFEQGLECINYLLRSNLEVIARKRALDYLANKTFTLQNIAFCDQKYWDVLVLGIQKLYELVDKLEYIKVVDAQDKILYRYILNNNISAARDFISRGGMKVIESESFKYENDFYVKLPHFDKIGSKLLITDFMLSKKQTELITHLERLKLDKNSIEIDGNAYFALIDYKDTDDFSFSLIIKHRKSGNFFEKKCTSISNDVIEKRTQHHFNTYRNSGFNIKIDFSEFEMWVEKEGLTFGEFDTYIRLTDINNHRTELSKFQGKSNRSECAVTNSVIIHSNNFIVCKWNASYGLVIDYRPEPVMVYENPKVIKKSIVLTATIGSNQNFTPEFVRLDSGKKQLNFDVNLISDHLFEVFIPTRTIDEDFTKYQLKVFSKQGTSRVIHSKNNELNFKSGQFLLKSTHVAALEIWNLSNNFLIDDWSFKNNKIIIKLNQPLDKNIKSSILSSNKMRFLGKILKDRKEIEYSLDFNKISDDSKQFKDIFYGGYQVVMVNELGLESKNVFWFNNNLRINQKSENQDYRITSRIVTNNTCEFLIEPQENLNRKGPIWGSNLRKYLAEQNTAKIDRKLVYLQCLRGDQVNDNQLAICNELLKQGGWRIIWGIEDNSVTYPQNTDAVLIGSNEYWHVLRHAEYLCYNHEVPSYLEAGKDQKIIQTYHGHPFKSMGMKRWKASNLNELQIKESLKIREKWDFLMSPSPAATQMYKDNFPVRAEIIEVGHPRNDILSNFNENDYKILRDKIGIPQGKKAVLFAPTWRDYATSDPWSSSVPLFIKPEELADQLGDEFIVLFRGHPAHGRKGIENIVHNKVIDVTYWKDVNDLLIACDIGVYDYSSIRFDHAVTRKPMVFFVPDKELYFKHIPPLIEYDETTPGPQVVTLVEVANYVKDLSHNFDWQSSQKYKEFVNRFVPYDDGFATKRFVSKVFF